MQREERAAGRRGTDRGTDHVIRASTFAVLLVAVSLLLVAAAGAQERKIAPGTWVGCVDRGALEQIATYRAKKDIEAATKELSAGIRTGRCTVFKDGESVVVTETTVIAGVTKIRRAGGTTEYWVHREALLR